MTCGGCANWPLPCTTWPPAPSGGVADGMSAENEPAADPGQFLREVANADEGWSERYGGPEGIARWTLNLQDALKEQASDLAAVRTAAIREMLTTRSLADIAQALGVSKQAVSKAANSPTWTDPRW